ncbi:hypothetical protein ASG79_17350 [Arthrobacter sp. Soil761]|nr:hypothetical protein ASG79_17350 [Arthrobacter sp. Soil761]
MSFILVVSFVQPARGKVTFCTSSSSIWSMSSVLPILVRSCETVFPSELSKNPKLPGGLEEKSCPTLGSDLPRRR